MFKLVAFKDGTYGARKGLFFLEFLNLTNPLGVYLAFG